MSVIHARSEWTSTPEGFSYPLRPAVVYGTAFHHPAMSAFGEGKSDSWNAQQLRNFRAYHVNARGWADIGYNLAIAQTGSAWWAAGLTKAAHCASPTNPLANTRWFGILLILGNGEQPSTAMRKTANAVLDEVQQVLPRVRENITGHRLVPGAQTECPGNEALSLITSGKFFLDYDVVAPVVLDRTYDWTPIVKPELINERLLLAGFGIGGRIQDYDRAAVARYQAAQLGPVKLVADGLWGRVTEDHYNWVVDLQLQLERVGGKLNADGSYGEWTATNVRNFQKAQGLVEDGVAGPITCAALGLPPHP